MRYIKEMQHVKVEQEIDFLLDRAVVEMLREEFSLLERSGSSSSDYNFDNGAKMSDTLVGKLFGKIWKLVTLNGLVTNKLGDIFGVKSNILKRLANKLEEAIGKLPSEFLERSSMLNVDTRRLVFYDELKTFFDAIVKPSLKTDVAIKIFGDLIVACESVVKDLDLTVEEQKGLDDEVQVVLKEAKNLEKKLLKLDPAKNVDYIKLSTMVANKADIISKFNALSAKTKSVLTNVAKEKRVGDFTETTTSGSTRSTYRYKGGVDDDSVSGERVSGATKSMYDIVAIINKAYDLYMIHEEGEDGKEHLKRDSRLFKLWEKLVMKILGSKGDLLPLTLKKYVNSSLHEDFKKYEVKGESGYTSRNVLDELNNIDSIINKVEKSDRTGSKPDVKLDTAVFNSGKSTSATFGYEASAGKVVVSHNQFENSPIILKVSSGQYFENDVKLRDLKDNLITILPTQMSSAKMFTGVLSWSDNIFDNVKTTSGFRYDVDAMHMETLGSMIMIDQSVLKIGEYFYMAVNSRGFSRGTELEILCYSPLIDVKKALVDNKPTAKFIVTVSDVYTLKGLDNNVVYLDSAEIRKIFSLGQTNFKLIDQYYKNNNK